MTSSRPCNPSPGTSSAGTTDGHLPTNSARDSYRPVGRFGGRDNNSADVRQPMVRDRRPSCGRELTRGQFNPTPVRRSANGHFNSNLIAAPASLLGCPLTPPDLIARRGALTATRSSLSSCLGQSCRNPPTSDVHPESIVFEQVDVSGRNLRRSDDGYLPRTHCRGQICRNRALGVIDRPVPTHGPHRANPTTSSPRPTTAAEPPWSPG
jgi:hypothetical protein